MNIIINKHEDRLNKNNDMFNNFMNNFKVKYVDKYFTKGLKEYVKNIGITRLRYYIFKSLMNDYEINKLITKIKNKFKPLIFERIFDDLLDCCIYEKDFNLSSNNFIDYFDNMDTMEIFFDKYYI